MNRLYILILLAILFTLNVADIITTHIAISAGAIEGNAFARYAMETIGYLSASIWKLIFISAAIGILFFVSEHNSELGIGAICYAVGYSMCVVINNIMVILN